MPRKQNRIPVSLNVFLEWSSGRREVRVSDLSLGGCFIECLTPITDGESVSFKIEVASGEWLEFEGEVVYLSPGVGFGVQFCDLTEAQRSVLEHFILIKDGNPWQGDQL